MNRLLCFHGTSYENGMSIINSKHFNASANENLRMGEGAYFFCQMGDSPDYAIRCAREVEKYHYKEGKHTSKYMVISCEVECDEESFLDLCDPRQVEAFHEMRYVMLNKSLKEMPEFEYKSAAVADTQVFDELRSMYGITVIRCPQFFGMLAEEQKFRFPKGTHPYPKTYVPNVFNVCVNTEKVAIRNLKIVEEGDWNDEIGSEVG